MSTDGTRVPSKAEEALAEAFVEYHHYHRISRPHATEAEAKSAARKLLARVKCDAAREALDGVVDEYGFQMDRNCITDYRDTHYPEGDL